MIEWLCKELDRTLVHGLSSYLGIGKGRNKDDGNIAFLFFQPGLQLQARHLRHADVNDQARGRAMHIGFEERFCRSKASYLKARGLDQVTQGVPHQFAVFDDGNDFGRLVLLQCGKPYIVRSITPNAALFTARANRCKWKGGEIAMKSE